MKTTESFGLVNSHQGREETRLISGLGSSQSTTYKRSFDGSRLVQPILESQNKDMRERVSE
jgi:hypothetical protein